MHPRNLLVELVLGILPRYTLSSSQRSLTVPRSADETSRTLFRVHSRHIVTRQVPYNYPSVTVIQTISPARHDLTAFLQSYDTQLP